MQVVEMNKKYDNNLFDLQAFHGAALVDEQGREIPITEEMISNETVAFSNEKSCLTGLYAFST